MGALKVEPEITSWVRGSTTGHCTLIVLWFGFSSLAYNFT